MTKQTNARRIEDYKLRFQATQPEEDGSGGAVAAFHADLKHTQGGGDLAAVSGYLIDLDRIGASEVLIDLPEISNPALPDTMPRIFCNADARERITHGVSIGLSIPRRYLLFIGSVRIFDFENKAPGDRLLLALTRFLPINQPFVVFDILGGTDEQAFLQYFFPSVGTFGLTQTPRNKRFLTGIWEGQHDEPQKAGRQVTICYRPD